MQTQNTVPMKNGFITCLLVTCCSLAFAQTDTASAPKAKTEKNHVHYLSINGTYFLQQFLNFTNGNTIITPSPYIVEYRYQPGKHGFRVGLGGSFSQKKSNLDSSQIQITNSTTLNARAGYVYHQHIAKRWSFFAGADAVVTYTNSFLRNNTIEDIVTTTTKSVAVGGGPSFGIEFAISKRVGLFTETALYYQYVYSTNGLTSVNFPETNTKTNSSEHDIKFIIPTSLFFYIKI